MIIGIDASNISIGGGEITIYGGLLMSVVFFDSTVNTIFVNWIRMLPSVFILQYMALKR